MDALQSSVYRLIQQFVQRQSLCREVLQEYRPHLLDSTKRRPTKEYSSATHTGHWGSENEWDYYLHGGGCRLTNKITKEVIEWDASDLKRFDPYWFVGWLTWFLTTGTSEDETMLGRLFAANKDSEDFRKIIFAVLEQLHELGKLRYYPDRTNMYKLILD